MKTSSEHRPSSTAAEQSLVRLTAMEAIVQLLLDQAARDQRAGLNTGGFATGYPGSPLGGLQTALEKSDARLKASNIHQAPGLNEELAATAVWGSQTAPEMPEATVDGVFGLWYAKAPGVDRAADALRHGNIRGAHSKGGVLVLAGDDPNANATNFPTDSNSEFQAFGMPILYPGSVQEILDLGHHGYQLSRVAGLWVGFKMVTTVADGSGSVNLDPERLSFVTPEVRVNGSPFTPVLRTKSAGAPMREAERDLIGARKTLAEKYIELNDLNPITVNPKKARIGIVAPGKTYFDVRRALENLGLDDEALDRDGIRVKKVSALYPIGRDEWEHFAEGLDEIIVVEEKRPFLETALKHALYDSAHRPRISGKTAPDGVTELIPQFGELGPNAIARRLALRLDAHEIAHADLSARSNPRTLLPISPLSSARTGFFCSGCPHNTSLNAPEGAVVAAGIGCHILSVIVERDEYGLQTGFTQMGGEGAQWVGQQAFTTLNHIFQNVGDGTYHHSASLALRASVAAGTNITYKILYNDTVGMTGGQDVSGAMSVPDLTRSLEAEGVKRVIVTTEEPKRIKRRGLAKNVVGVWHRDRIIEAQELLAKTPGVTVLIHDQQCAADRRRRWRTGEQEKTTQRVMINERVCEGCGDCNQKSQCLSVQPLQTELGLKTMIQQTSCNLDFTCLKGDCPSFVTVDVAKVRKSRKQVSKAPEVPLPRPLMPAVGFSAHMTGIGGTGVVSANGILAAAATLDGHRVRVFDLPGGTIKAGPVISQLQVFGEGDEQPAATIDPGEADVFLGFDMLAAMTPEYLAPLSPEKTLVVASTTIEPTGDMAIDSSIPLPSAAVMIDELDSRSRRDDNVYLDIAGLCDAILGSQGSANAMLIGAAFQAGAIPFSLDSLEQAFRNSGVAVEQNLLAFAWGRAAVADPARIAELRFGDRPSGGGTLSATVRALVEPFAGDLRDAIVYRIDDLRGYQGDAYAATFAKEVADFHAEALRRIGSEAEALTLDFAHGLHKLMAYKDEYEVARLLLLDSAREAVVNEFGEGAKISWNLHPPFLRALGMRNKLRLGAWFTPAFVVLRAMRKLRGTPLDVFGLTAMRRFERGLRDEYRAVMARALAALTHENSNTVAELARTPELVRGYEFVKARHSRSFLEAVPALSDQLGLDYTMSQAVPRLLERISSQGDREAAKQIGNAS